MSKYFITVRETSSTQIIAWQTVKTSIRFYTLSHQSFFSFLLLNQPGFVLQSHVQ